MNESLERIWFGAVRAAADAGEREIPALIVLDRLQKAKLHILIRQDQCDFLSLSIRGAEGISQAAANEIRDGMYSDLMEDAIAGIWSEEENLELLRFLHLCSDGVGDTETFCNWFSLALGEKAVLSEQDRDAVAQRVKKKADQCLDAFITERKTQYRSSSSGKQDDPPPWMDEFEYIDWVMTH